MLSSSSTCTFARPHASRAVCHARDVYRTAHMDPTFRARAPALQGCGRALSRTCPLPRLSGGSSSIPCIHVLPQCMHSVLHGSGFEVGRQIVMPRCHTWIAWIVLWIPRIVHLACSQFCTFILPSSLTSLSYTPLRLLTEHIHQAWQPPKLKTARASPRQANGLPPRRRRARPRPQGPA